MITLNIELFVKNKVRKIFQKYRSLIHEHEEILVLGDSHANVFKNKHIEEQFKNHFFNVIAVGGATISGLENPNSKTQALATFRKEIKKSKARTIIVLLGEVDTGFVIWHKSEKYKTNVSDMLDMAVQNYKDFLQQLSSTHRVICISTPLPTIKDEQDWGEIANARKDVKATQWQRTKITVQFNNIMEDFCNKTDIVYLSFDKESLNEKGLVHDSLLNPNPNDHHYDKDKYAEMIVHKIKNTIIPDAPCSTAEAYREI
jgi:hypothetical protein